jgi:hypothetical protein
MSLMANIRDEIRKLMAIHGMYKLYRKPQMTQKSMFQFLEDQFHGNDAAGIVSQVSQVVNGLPPYNALYKKQTDIVTNSSVSSSASVTSLVLKKEISQSEAVIIAGRDITVSVLENTTKTSKELVKGRKLFNDANTALKNIRKAWAVLKDLPEVSFVDNEIEYKSGVTAEEVKGKLLDGMHQLLKGKTSLDKNNKEEEDEDNTAINNFADQPRPAGWFFQGWMAFLLFGPFADEKERLDLISIGGHHEDRNKSSSRRACKKADAELKQKHRDAGNGCANGAKTQDITRGVSVTNQIGLATFDVKKQEIAICTKEINNNQRDDILMSMQMQMTNMCRLLESAVDIAKTMTSSFDEHNFLWKKVIKQQEAIEALQVRIDEFYDETKAIADEETRKRKISEEEPKESNKKPPSVIELLNNEYKTDDEDEDFSDSNKENSNKTNN